MIIKKFSKFLLFESIKYDYGCVMLKFDIDKKQWKELTSIIEKKDIYKYGIENKPHLTILYGLKSGVSLEDIKSIFYDIDNPINLEIKGIDIFENEEFDVVKLNVKKNSILNKLFNRASELPNDNIYKEYNPHITIAYVKKGTGKKYKDKSYKLEINNIDRAIYSESNGKKSEFNILKSNKIMESKSNSYSIFDFFEYVKRIRFDGYDKHFLRNMSDRFIGEGYYDKIMNKIEELNGIINKTDQYTLNQIFLPILDIVDIETEVHINLAYLTTNKYYKENLNFDDYSGYLTYDVKNNNYIIADILITILYPTLFVYDRKTDEEIFVTDDKWKCSNFSFKNIDQEKYMYKDILKEYNVDKIIEKGYIPGIAIEISRRNRLDTKEIDDIFKSYLFVIDELIDYKSIRYRIIPGFEYSVRILLK